MHDKLVVKVNNIDTSGFVLKIKYDTDKSELENKIENKIPSISGLAATSAFIAAENKIPDVSSLVKKTYYNTKITEIEKKLTNHDHDKYITTPEFKNLAARLFTGRLAQTNLVTKTYFDNKLKKLSQNINSNKTKHLLVEN